MYLPVKLLKRVLNYWMQRKVRRIFVTFAEEEFDELRGFFDKFGFLLDGIEPQFYRPGKTEYIMSKTFFYDKIDPDNFEDFVIQHLLKMRGIIPKSNGSEFVAHEDTGFSKTPRCVFIKIVKERAINDDELFHHVLQMIEETDSLYGIVVSYYPILNEAKDKRIKIVDGFLLENIFFPMRLEKDGLNGVMLPIEEEYAEKLLDMDEPQKKIAMDRVAIRHEKHFFSGRVEELSKIKDRLQRGGVFIFYQKKNGLAGIIGEAKIKLLTIEMAKGIFKKYGLEKSAFGSEDELLSHSNKGRIALFLLTCVKRYPKKIMTSGVYALLSEIGGINFQCQPLTQEQIDKIRDSTGDDLYSY